MHPWRSGDKGRTILAMVQNVIAATCQWSVMPVLSWWSSPSRDQTRRQRPASKRGHIKRSTRVRSFSGTWKHEHAKLIPTRRYGLLLYYRSCSRRFHIHAGVSRASSQLESFSTVCGSIDPGSKCSWATATGRSETGVLSALSPI